MADMIIARKCKCFKEPHSSGGVGRSLLPLIRKNAEKSSAFSDRFSRLEKTLPVGEDVKGGEQGVRRHILRQPVGAGERGALLLALRPAGEAEEHQIPLFRLFADPLSVTLNFDAV